MSRVWKPVTLHTGLAAETSAWSVTPFQTSGMRVMTEIKYTFVGRAS